MVVGSGLVSVARCPADATINCVQSPDLQMELNVGAFGPSRRLVMGASTQLLQLRGGGERGGGLLLVSKFQENVGHLVSAAWHCALRT